MSFVCHTVRGGETVSTERGQQMAEGLGDETSLRAWAVLRNNRSRAQAKVMPIEIHFYRQMQQRGDRPWEFEEYLELADSESNKSQLLTLSMADCARLWLEFEEILESSAGDTFSKMIEAVQKESR